MNKTKSIRNMLEISQIKVGEIVVPNIASTVHKSILPPSRNGSGRMLSNPTFKLNIANTNQ